MGEEEKKPPAEEEKKKDEAPQEDDGKKEEKKSEESKEADIVLKVFMHCEGCARKVRRCLKGFEGVEEVITDCRTSKVVVKGQKVDPLKVLERVQKKSHRQVELISPIPKPPPPPPQPEVPPEKELPKPEEIKQEPPVVTVVLGVYMHCEACAQGIKKRIQRMKGVELVEPDLKSSQVITKGAFEPDKLVEYVYKRTGKHVTVIKVEPEKKEEKKEEKKPEEGGEKEAKKSEQEESREGGANAAAGDGGGEPAEESKMELRKNESLYNEYPHNNYQLLYPQRFVHETVDYPPQMFSDENPNACSVM